MLHAYFFRTLKHLFLRTLGILSTTVPLQLFASTRPIERAIGETDDDGDDVVQVANELFGRVALTERNGALRDGCKRNERGLVSGVDSSRPRLASSGLTSEINRATKRRT